MADELIRIDDDRMVVGRGFAAASSLDVMPSRTVASSYADPLAWLVLSAVEHAIGDCGDEMGRDRDGVGHIAVSDHCTIHTMRGLAATIARGRISPMRFSGASPGSISSLACQILGLRGPSLTLSMPPDAGMPAALAVARMWLRQRGAEYVIISAHQCDESGEHGVSSAILRASDRKRTA